MLRFKGLNLLMQGMVSTVILQSAVPADPPAHPTPKGRQKQLKSSSSGGHSALAWIWGPPSSLGRHSCRRASLEPSSRVPLRVLATPSQVLVIMAVLFCRIQLEIAGSSLFKLCH